MYAHFWWVQTTGGLTGPALTLTTARVCEDSVWGLPDSPDDTSVTAPPPPPTNLRGSAAPAPAPAGQVPLGDALGINQGLEGSWDCPRVSE